MKKFLSLLIVAAFLAACVPVFAIGTADANPVGIDISNVHAAYLTAGGNPSTTNFLTAEDFASHTLTFINIWSNGCGPCINEMPYFQQLHETYGDQGILVVGCCSTWIGGSYSAEWTYLQNHNYTYMNVIEDNVLYSLYSQNNYVPQTFIVNSDGIVIDFIGGGTTYQNLVNKINQWYAVFESDQYYDVTFVNGANNEVLEVQSVHAGHFPVYPDAPEMTGYNFTGWDPPHPPPVISNMTITACYSPITYRVRFYDSITGNKIGSSQFIQYGQPVTPPDPPEHEGYTFVGWDHDLSCVLEAMDVYTIYVQGAFTPGDMDGDGQVSVNDSLVVLRGAMGLTQLSPEQQQAADLNGDGQVTIDDALMALRKAMGLIA